MTKAFDAIRICRIIAIPFYKQMHGGNINDRAGIGFTHPATSGKVRGSNLCLRVAAGQSDERIF